uniref:Collectin subfamily member 10 n=1 Tax=Hippocampus comes TaxID=109280 RepID=A0A3Q2YXJ6_HIPCM
GEVGSKGDVGHIGKMGPIGAQESSVIGDDSAHIKHLVFNHLGTTCDCGRYRKVIGQMDVNLGKLRNTVKFVKKIMLGLTESDEHYYLLVKEAKRFKEASMNCELRGGILAMPTNIDSNRLIADYVSQSGLTRVYIGVQAKNTDTLTVCAYLTYRHRFETNHNASCVELLSTGTWSHVECDMAMFFICEFPKSRIRG